MSDTTETKGKIGHNGRWRRVERAREHLDANANKIMRAMVAKAVAGDVKAGRWLLEHTAVEGPTGAELRPIASGVDKPEGNAQRSGDDAPRILIGVSLGGDFARLATSQPTRLNANQSDPPVLDAQVVPHPVSPTR